MSGNRKQIYLQHKNYNMRFIEELFNIIAPHLCISCQKEGDLICYDCRMLMASPPPRCYVCGRWSDGFRTCPSCRRRTSIHSLWTTATYEGAAKELVHRLKFERARAAAVPMADMLAAVLQEIDTGTMVLVPLPTATSRVRERGYDQATLIARELSRRLAIPLVPCLARQGQQRQVGSRRSERKTQMAEAFRVVGHRGFLNKHVLLVDDVLTTGATCEAAARLLRHAGAKRVSAAVFAVA